MLEAVDVDERLQLVLEWARQALAELMMAERIRNDVAEGMDKTQREFLLRQQMAAIRKELGDGDDDALDDYRAKAAELPLPENVRAQVEREIDRLERSSGQSPEQGWIRTWLDRVLELPWGKRLRRPARHDRGAGRPRRRPHRPRRREGPHRRVPRRAQAARRARHVRRRRDATSTHARAPARSSRSSVRRASARRRSVSRSRARSAAGSCASRSAACATRPRSAATAAPTSARSPGGSSARSPRPEP